MRKTAIAIIAFMVLTMACLPIVWADEGSDDDEGEPYAVDDMLTAGGAEDENVTLVDNGDIETDDGDVGTSEDADIISETGRILIDCGLIVGDATYYTMMPSKEIVLKLEYRDENKLGILLSADFEEGKIIYFRIWAELFEIEPYSDVILSLDRERVGEVSLSEVLSTEGSEPSFAVMERDPAMDDNGTVFAVYIPHFSEYIITIEKVIEISPTTPGEGIGRTGMVSIIAGILTFSILIFNVVRLRKHR